jgi:hypothetical protein
MLENALRTTYRKEVVPQPLVISRMKMHCTSSTIISIMGDHEVRHEAHHEIHAVRQMFDQNFLLAPPAHHEAILQPLQQLDQMHQKDGGPERGIHRLLRQMPQQEILHAPPAQRHAKRPVTSLQRDDIHERLWQKGHQVVRTELEIFHPPTGRRQAKLQALQPLEHERENGDLWRGGHRVAIVQPLQPLEKGLNQDFLDHETSLPPRSG